MSLSWGWRLILRSRRPATGAARVSVRSELILIEAYLALKERVEDVIKALGDHKNDAEHFYEVRAADPSGLDPASAPPG